MEGFTQNNDAILDPFSEGICTGGKLYDCFVSPGERGVVNHKNDLVIWKSETDIAHQQRTGPDDIEYPDRILDYNKIVPTENTEYHLVCDKCKAINDRNVWVACNHVKDKQHWMEPVKNEKKIERLKALYFFGIVETELEQRDTPESKMN
jgi:hypothetical protein